MDRQQARRWLITRVLVSGMVDRNSLRSASELPYIDAEFEDAYYQSLRFGNARSEQRIEQSHDYT
jgi:hypothetical protein